jgi:3-hydroxybutyryl-CoA dehydrogenase
MGSGIVEVCAAAGYEVRVREVSPAALEKGLERIDASLRRAVARGKRSDEERQQIAARVHGTLELTDLTGSEVVIEAVVEELGAKREVLGRLDEICASAGLLASNTSSLSVTALAAATSRPERVVGLHFFNPVPAMKLVEVARSPLTSQACFERACGFAESLGKVAVRTADSTGFVVNRLLVPFLLDAIRALEEGAGSIRDIDEGMRLGCGHPMGPLTLLDFVGLDTTLAIADIMFEEFREKRFAPPPLLKRLVQAGMLGRKSGRGFYDYASDPPTPSEGLCRGR